MTKSHQDKEWLIYLQGLKEFNDKENHTIDLSALPQEENKSKESYLTKGGKVVELRENTYTCTNEGDKKFVVKINEEESLCPSNRNQQIIKEQEYEERIDVEVF